MTRFRLLFQVCLQLQGEFLTPPFDPFYYFGGSIYILSKFYFVYLLFTNYNSHHGLVCLFATCSNITCMDFFDKYDHTPPFAPMDHLFLVEKGLRSEYVGAQSQLKKAFIYSLHSWTIVSSVKNPYVFFTSFHGIVWFLGSIQTCVNSPTIHLVDIILYICYRYIYSKLTYEENIRT